MKGENCDNQELVQIKAQLAHARELNQKLSLELEANLARTPGLFPVNVYWKDSIDAEPTLAANRQFYILPRLGDVVVLHRDGESILYKVKEVRHVENEHAFPSIFCLRCDWDVTQRNNSVN